jgi:2-dehydropantoate 2-reductase
MTVRDGAAARYIVVGAGAIGGLAAALLARAGYDVVVVARGLAFRRIHDDGLEIVSPEGTDRVNLPVVPRLDELTAIGGDIALLAVKSQDTGSALSALRKRMPGVPIVCLQNGVDNERQALRYFLDVYGAFVNCPVLHLEPGHIRSFSYPCPGVIDIGRHPGGSDELAVGLVAALTRAGFSSVVREDITRWKYAKLLSNVKNAVDAACGWGARQGELARLVVDEAQGCFEAACIGVASQEEVAGRISGFVTDIEAEGSVFSGSSTWQSLERGLGTTEVDFLNGEISLLGRIYGVSTVANSYLQSLIYEMSKQGIRPGGVAESEVLSAIRGG